MKNNPLKYTDPSGFFFKKIFRAIKKVFKKIKKYIKTIIVVVVAVVVTIYTAGAAAAWLATLGPSLGTVAGFVAAAVPTALGSALGAIIGAAVGGFVGGMLGSMMNGGSISDGLSAGLKGAIWGAVSGAVAGAIGHHFGDASWVTAKNAQAFGTATAKAMLHGVTRAVISKAQGARWNTGFWSGFAGAAFGPGTKLGGDGSVGFTLRTTIAALVGGTVSKFSNGAVSAAFVHMFNAEGSSIVKAFVKFEEGMEKIGDYLARISGVRDLQNPSVMGYTGEYQAATWEETKEVVKLLTTAVGNPSATAKGIRVYMDNVANKSQLEMNSYVNFGIGTVVPGAGLISAAGHIMSEAHEINKSINGVK